MSIISKFIGAISGKARKSETTAKPPYGVPTIKFDPALVTETVKADIRKSVGQINDVPPEYFDQVYDVAVRAITAGGDLHALSVAIMQMNIDGMTKKRAGQIALSLYSKAMAIITRERQQRLGITEAIWMYSGAPCDVNPKKPQGNQNACHKAANGKRFKITEGMLLDGKWTWPGYEAGCKCVSQSIFPGFKTARKL